MVKFNKTFFRTFLIILFIFIFSSCKKSSEKIIGIVQYGNSERLNDCYKSLEKTLQEEFEDIDSYKIIYKNANFNKSLASKAADELVKKNVKIIISIGEDASIQCASSANQTGIPVVYTGFLNSSAMKRWTNVSGLCSVKYCGALLDNVKKFFNIPTVTVAVIGSRDDQGTKTQIEKLREIAYDKKVIIYQKYIDLDADLYSSAKKMMSEFDRQPNCFILIDDDVINNKVGEIIKVANENNIPVFGIDKYQLQEGCLSCVCIDYSLMGAYAAYQVIEILEGGYILNVSKAKIENFEFAYNKSILDGFSNTNRYMKEPDDIDKFKEIKNEIII